MPNTSSAKKALRQSKRKQTQNLLWKKRIREVSKSIKKQLKNNDTSIDIIREEERVLNKVVDKAAKNNVIHKNKAKRIKSKLAKSIAAHEESNTSKKKKEKATTTTGSKSKS